MNKPLTSKELIIGTSNKSKLEEIKEIIKVDLKSLDNPIDIKEVCGTPIEIILHKARDARKLNNITDNQSIIVEDTILRDLDNSVDIIDIRWKVDELKEGTNVSWITNVAINDGDNIYVFQGVTEGVITRSRGDEGVAFDPYFIPKILVGVDFFINGVNLKNKTLAELKRINLKNMFSSRNNALAKMISNEPFLVFKLDELKNWNGKYQND